MTDIYKPRFTNELASTGNPIVDAEMRQPRIDSSLSNGNSIDYIHFIVSQNGGDEPFLPEGSDRVIHPVWKHGNNATIPCTAGVTSSTSDQEQNGGDEPSTIYASGKQIILDAEDIPLVSKYKWNLDKNGYPRRSINKKQTLYIHQLLIGKKDGFVIDHIDGNPLNNKKENLRHVTRAENLANGKKMSGRGISSKYKGVSYNKKRNLWVASIAFSGVQKNLGGFAIEEEAATAYNKAAKEIYGDVARLNKLPEKEGWEDASTRKDEGLCVSAINHPPTYTRQELVEVIASANRTVTRNGIQLSIPRSLLCAIAALDALIALGVVRVE